MRYFSYDPEDGMNFHKTEEEARKSAEDYIEKYRIDAVDGWSDEVDGVCWGEVKEAATVVHREKPDPEIYPDFDEIIDYGLRSTD